MKRMICLLALSVSCSVYAEDPVDFHDLNLKAAIETKLGILNPTPTDMLGLDDDLLAANADIKTLRGLEHATNLQRLYLHENEIEDISALSGLINLTYLNLSHNRIGNISPLSDLSHLIWLNLAYNEIKDISPLSEHSHGSLEYLYLHYNALVDISTLSSLTSLDTLTLNHNHVIDISVLSGLSEWGNLYQLDLRLNPLNRDACTIHIPQIFANIPDIELLYSPCEEVFHTLTISSTPGGSAQEPGEGHFFYPSRQLVDVNAVADPNYVFRYWSGSAVDTGQVADPNSAVTTVSMEGDYTLKAHFDPCSPYFTIIEDMDFDDPIVVAHRVVFDANLVEHDETEGVLRITGTPGSHWLSSIRMGKTRESHIRIRLKYRFKRSGQDPVLTVYVSDRPRFLGPGYVEAGLIVPPPAGWPGSLEHTDFGVFEAVVALESLDLTQELWIELKLTESDRFPMNTLSKALLANASGSVNSTWEVDDVEVTTLCSGICMDLDHDNIPTEQDFLMAWIACGRMMPSDGRNPLWCLDVGFGADGYADIMDMAVWDWAHHSCLDCLGNLCLQPTSVRGKTTTNAPIQLPSQIGSRRRSSTQVNPSGSFLLLGKPLDPFFDEMVWEDNLCRLEPTGVFLTQAPPHDLLDHCNVRLVRGSDETTYVVNTKVGVVTLDGRPIVTTDSVTFNGKNVHVGFQGNIGDRLDRPVLDAVVEGNEIYVVPVQVQPPSGDGYLAAAKLTLQGEGSFKVSQLFYDPNLHLSKGNPNVNSLREVERDEQGNIYVLNVYKENHSDLLWKYDAHGAVKARVDLNSLNIQNPIGLCYAGDLLHLALGLYDWTSPEDVKVTVCGLSIEDLSLTRTIEVSGMHNVTSITRGPDQTIYVLGIKYDNLLPKLDYSDFGIPLPIPSACFAEIPPGHHNLEVTATELSGDCDLALPMSILWTGDLGRK